MMHHLDVWTVTGLLATLGLLELLFSERPRRGKGELLADIVSLGQFAFIIKPLIIAGSAYLMGVLFPRSVDAWAGLPIWQGVLLALVPADLLHYLYHRLGHSFSVTWGMHRTHHTATVMSVSVSFRENWRWFFFMPDLWYSGALIYLGLGPSVLISTLIFGCANVLVHSGLAWDRALYESRWLRPVVWTLERLIQLPSTHRAHHAIFDGYGKPPHHNFAQLFMIWDTLLGTAYFPRGKDPKGYGVPYGQSTPWFVQLWSPFSTEPRYRRAIDEHRISDLP